MLRNISKQALPQKGMVTPKKMGHIQKIKDKRKERESQAQEECKRDFRCR
jgi:hypothetical protein